MKNREDISFFDYKLSTYFFKKNEYSYRLFFSHPANLVRPGHLGVLRDLRDHALVWLKVDCNLLFIFIAVFTLFSAIFILSS